jgi:hypothetical protein
LARHVTSVDKLGKPTVVYYKTCYDRKETHAFF